MKLVKAAEAMELVGLTRSQLREWTGRGRRHLIVPDVEADGPGKHALYAWQTLLVLRLLLALQTHFAAEVGAWASAGRDLRRRLDYVAFSQLWGSSAFFPSPDAVLLIDRSVAQDRAGVILPLDPHLTALAEKLVVSRPIQMSLFQIEAA